MVLYQNEIRFKAMYEVWCEALCWNSVLLGFVVECYKALYQSDIWMWFQGDIRMRFVFCVLMSFCFAIGLRSEFQTRGSVVRGRVISLSVRCTFVYV